MSSRATDAVGASDLALKPAFRITQRHARRLPRTPRQEPLTLQLSVTLALADVAEEPSEPLPLKLAYALGSAAAQPESARAKIEAVDVALAEPVFYGIRVNREEHSATRLLRFPDGRLLARRADLEEWRLRLPDTKPILYRGEEYFLLDAYGDVRYEFDTARQELGIEFPPKYFAGTVLEAEVRRRAMPVPPGPGGFLNYDVLFSSVDRSNNVGGIFEGAFFSRAGVGLTSVLAESGAGEKRLVRLETSWTHDFPEEMKTLTLGDTIGSSGIWGRPVRYGGVRYGTNFATNPGFVTFPLPALRGEAALPTATELYVNGVLRQSSSVPPGPFQINSLPVMTGQGEVRLVVRDLLGREQVISVPYYTSSQLLRAGLTDASNELGFVRDDFGLRSNDYGRAVLALQRRRGFTDALTGEARAEVLRGQQTAGAGASVAVTNVGVLTGAIAASHSERGTGTLFFSSLEHQVLRGVSFGVRSQWMSRAFTQLGLQPDQLAPARVMSANIGVSPPGFGSFGISYIRQDSRDLASTEIVGATYTIGLPLSSALIVAAFKPLRGEASAAVSVTLSFPLGERRSGFVGYTGQGRANDVVAQVQQNLPAGSGLGYRLLAGAGSQRNREEASFAYQTTSGTYIAEAGRAGDITSYRLNATGAVAVVDNHPFLMRQLSDSFGVARVPGFANVGIYVNNQLIGRTDAAGYAVLPRLLPYQSNPVRIELADLPIDAQIAATQIDAVPYFRSGLLLDFPVQRSKGALLTLQFENNEPVPSGSTVTLLATNEEFPVAARGEAFVTGLSEKNRIRVSARDRTCEIAFDLPADSAPLPRLGPLVCHAGAK